MSIRDTKEWFNLAIPKPTVDNQRVQLGVHCEEFVEMLAAINIPSFEIKRLNALNALHDLATILKTNKELCVVVHNRQEFLDGLADQVVTATGCSHMFGMDLPGALEEVNESNFSKFVDGKPIFNEHGKIGKGPDYFKPDLTKFVGEDPIKVKK